VGAVSGAAPTTGTFNEGDFALDVSNLTLWICTTAGSPGTWTSPYNQANTWTAQNTFSAGNTVSNSGIADPMFVGQQLGTGYSTVNSQQAVFIATTDNPSPGTGVNYLFAGFRDWANTKTQVFAVDGMGNVAAAGAATAEGNQLLQSLSGGYKVQSGTAGTFSLTASSSLATSITFPVAFSNTAYATSFTVVLPSSGSGDGIEIWVNSRTTTSVGIAIYSSTTQTISLDYTVIGS
jgi:hypothetical protein